MEAIKKTFGGQRIGSGNKMEVDLKTYNRSTHNLSYDWKSSMSCGTLVPFMKFVALNADTFDIDLNALVHTKPTVAPIFGSFKMQLDIFQVPLRLYNGLLHNNAIKIGLDMGKVKFPKLNLKANEDDTEYSYVGSGSLLNYLGMGGVFIDKSERKINAIPILAYMDIFKQYYSNKQEDNAYYIDFNQTPIYAPANVSYHNTYDTTTQTWSYGDIITWQEFITNNILPEENLKELGSLAFQGSQVLDPQYIMLNEAIFNRDAGNTYISIADAAEKGYIKIQRQDENKSIIIIPTKKCDGVALIELLNNQRGKMSEPEQLTDNIKGFPLENIDLMREEILRNTKKGTELIINDVDLTPYNQMGDAKIHENSQQFLLLKTYQSDLFNNWLSSETINGINGISEITSVATTDGSFTIDALNLAQKVYNMLNMIAASGGTYEDWQEARYGSEAIRRAESPIYEGGASYEINFQEIVSTAETETETGGSQALGTLAGKGILNGKKGGHVTIKVKEPAYIIGIVSITPRINYCQGNDWDLTELDSPNDLHAPELDGIGFQDLMMEQLAWWTTKTDESGTTKKAVGKTPAWINYMTNVNKVYGDFCIDEKAGYMVLKRTYKQIDDNDIADMTTYIEPQLYNEAFADTTIESQNFWVQIACNVEARRKMSAKIMPIM